MPVNRKPMRGLGLAAGVALALSLVPAAPDRALAESADAMRAAPVDGGARIVFEWPETVRQNAVIGGKILVITFGEAFTGNPQSLAATLPGVVERVDVSRDRRVLTIVLTEPYELDRDIQGARMVLTLAEPEAAPPAVRASYGRHEGFDRVVFDWPEAVEYEVVTTPGHATITFDRAGRIDLGRLRAALAGTGITVETVGSGEPLAVRLGFPEDRDVWHFQDGSAVVVDLRTASGETTAAAEQPEPAPEAPAAGAEPDSEPPEPAAQPAVEAPGPPEPAPEAPPTGAEPDGEPPEPAAEPAEETLAPTESEPETAAAEPEPAPTEAGKTPAQPEAESPAAPSEATPAEPEAAPAPGPEHAPAAPETAQGGAGAGPMAPEAVPPEAAAPEETPPPTAATPPAGEAGEAAPAVVVAVAGEGERTIVTLPFETRVPAAVFRRAGAVWAVFGEARELILPDGPLPGPGVFEAAQVPNGRATVLRIAAAPDIVPEIAQDGSGWRLTLAPGTLAPKRAAAVEAEPHAIRGGRLTVKGQGGGPIRVDDPVVGDQLIVVPFSAPGLGVQPGRRFAQLRLLPTAQGVAIEPLADGITVISDPEGVRITAEPGLRLSPRASAVPEPSPFDGARIFDFAQWLGGRPDAFPLSYERVKQQRLHRIASASDAERNNRRLDLARFFFAHGQGTDAVAVLRLALEDDEDLLRRPEVRALRGAARLLTHDVAGADQDLSHASLDAEPEVALWRGAMAADRRNWRSAVANFAQADGLLRHYPRRLKVEFALMAAEAELRAGDTERARMFLAMVEAEEPEGRTLQEVAYLKGSVLERTGQPDAALAQWDELVKRGEGPSRIKAAVSTINLKLSAGSLDDVTGAIEHLDRLRFAWRGDALEFGVLHALGRLYLRDGQYRRGFDTLNRAARLYPAVGREQNIEDEMRTAFAELYLSGAVDDLSPIEALALFDDYRALMPADARGDEMIASLVDRLVAVDLLGRAANLLTQQIETRLTGLDRARVGARLALVLLLDDQPRRAVNALEATRVPGMPSELTAQRTRLSARGFAEMDRGDRALQILTGDGTDEADRIRLDLHWRAQDWGKAADVLARLADKITAREAGVLGEEDSRTVLRLAVALALDGDTAGLAYLRSRFDRAMADGPYREAYAILTTQMDRRGLVSYETIAATIREVDQYQAFMASYRERLQDAGLSTIN